MNFIFFAYNLTHIHSLIFKYIYIYIEKYSGFTFEKFRIRTKRVKTHPTRDEQNWRHPDPWAGCEKDRVTRPNAGL